MQISDQMVEAVAKAIYNATHHNKPYMQLSAFQKDKLRTQARAALQAALAGHVDDWRDIASAPKDGTWVLVFNSLGNIHVAKWGLRYLGDPGPEHWICDGKYVGGCVTHWQPLPAAPAQREG